MSRASVGFRWRLFLWPRAPGVLQKSRWQVRPVWPTYTLSQTVGICTLWVCIWEVFFIFISPMWFTTFLDVLGLFGHILVIVFARDKLHKFAIFTSLILRRSLKRIYFPTNALHDTTYTTHIKTPMYFGTEVPSSGNYYNKCVCANLLIYVLFIFIILIKTSVVKYIKYINILIICSALIIH
jgi:hypothetical protein